ncbi:hypothetical protein LJK88_00945 [Paenibacillus sp. P26]|nr:hypothetical protein LJK88_00945 [Paenibacillus sp. P26]
MRALAFDGYRLVLTAADGTMVYRTFTRTDTSVAVPSSGSDSGGGYSPVPAACYFSRQIGSGIQADRPIRR